MEIARSRGEAVSIAYVGNVVDLLEYLVERKVRVDLGMIRRVYIFLSPVDITRSV